MSTSENDSGDKRCKFRDKLNEMRKQDKLCDITIRVDGREFRAHKAVLSAASCYFEKMFSGGFKEGTAKEIEITGSADSFELILEYMYTEELHLFVENAKADLVCGFLDLACYMQINSVFEYCTYLIQYMYERATDSGMPFIHQLHGPDVDEDDDESGPIPVADAFQYLLFAKMREHELADLARLSARYLKENLTELETCDEILENATVEFMEDFLSDEYLATKEEEEQVLNFVINWLKSDWETRQDHAYRLLQKIRLGLVSPHICRSIFEDEIFGSIPECKNLLHKVKKIRDGGVEQRFPELFTTRSTVTVAVSGHAEWIGPFIPNCNKTCFEYYDVGTQDWKSIDGFQQLPVDAENHALCYVPSLGRLYLAGGSNKEKCSRILCPSHLCSCTFGYVDTPQRCFFRFDKIRNQWEKLPPMINKRSHFSLIHLGCLLFAIGGRPYLTQVEYYDTSLPNGRWCEAAPLLSTTTNMPYSSVSAVAFNEVILAYGHGKRFSKLNIYYPKCNEHLCVKCRESKVKEGEDNDNDEDEDEDDFQCNTWHRFCGRLHVYRPVLFVHNGVCYRIIFVHSGNRKLSIPIVQVLNIETCLYSKKKKVTIGQHVNQDYIPYNAVGAFRIQDRVFATKHVSVFDTGIRIAEDQHSDVDLDKIEAVFRRTKDVGTSIVTFPFDKRDML